MFFSFGYKKGKKKASEAGLLCKMVYKNKNKKPCKVAIMSRANGIFISMKGVFIILILETN